MGNVYTDLKYCSLTFSRQPLQFSTKNRHLKTLLQIALRFSASLMALVLQDGYSPLFTASINGHSEVVNTLIKAGANINQCVKVCTVHLSLCYTKYVHV